MYYRKPGSFRFLNNDGEATLRILRRHPNDSSKRTWLALEVITARMVGGQEDEPYASGMEEPRPYSLEEREVTKLFNILKVLTGLGPDDVFSQATEDRTRSNGAKP